MNTFNTAVFQWIAGLITAAPWLLPLMRATAVGGAYAAAALALWSLLRYPLERRYVLCVLIACGCTTLLSHYLGALTAVPRPFAVGLSPLYIKHSPTGSMPSSHASVLMLIALLYLYRKPLRRLGYALAGVAVATSAARIFVGVHYPLDIIAAFTLALVLAGIFRWLHGLVRRLRHLADGAAPRWRSSIGSKS